MTIIQLDSLLQTEPARGIKNPKGLWTQKNGEVLEAIQWVKHLMGGVGGGKDMEEMETVQKAITAYPRVVHIIQQYVHYSEKNTIANKNRIEKDIER